MDYSIKIGGEAGQGIQTIGGTLARVFSRTGYHVFTHQDYESRIRGGHNFYQVRFADTPVSASREKIDILVAFDNSSILLHEQELFENGLIVYDSTILKKKYVNLAVEHGGNTIMANTTAIGAVLGMLGMELDVLKTVFQETFRKKGQEVIEGNIRAAQEGYNYAKENCSRCSFTVPAGEDKNLMLINGAEAIGLGAISSGCKFYSAYPMTPSTGIMNYIASKEEDYGIIVEQAEDEIAAINMALGASFAGVRAFALMVEGLSLAAATETPIVIALAQRPGPATGLPTRTEQADLLFALHSAHGEFPRVIFAPGTPEQAFYLTSKAFDMAERFQIPVIILTDQYLGDSQWTFEEFDISRLRYKDYRLRGDKLKTLPEYRRHAFTEGGVSALGIPGDSHHLVVTDSDEHDEEGHIIEDAETRIKMVDKRLLKKLPLIRQEIDPPLLYGDAHPEIVLVGWGSTYGVIKEAVDVLSGKRSIAMLHFSELHPLPSKEKLNYLKILHEAKLALCIENNATGQFARIIKTETGFIFFDSEIKKYDGRPFTLETLLGDIHAHFTRL
jgi:2-oxoglutarate ferredoxin oxidoreductase subunit alpha